MHDELYRMWEGVATHFKAHLKICLEGLTEGTSVRQLARPGYGPLDNKAILKFIFKVYGHIYGCTTFVNDVYNLIIKY